MWIWWRRHPDDIQIQRFQEGLLPPGATRRMQGHIDACPQCQASLSAYSRLNELLSRMPASPMPLDLTDQILDCVLAEQPVQTLPALVGEPNRLQGLIGGMVALLAAGLLVFWPTLSNPELGLGFVAGVIKFILIGIDAGVPVIRGLFAVLEQLRYPALMLGASLTVLFAWLASRRLSTELSLPEGA